MRPDRKFRKRDQPLGTKKEIARQSMMIGYLNAFTMYTVTSGLAVVFVLMVRGRRAT
jgi:hypothetical protein